MRATKLIVVLALALMSLPGLARAATPDSRRLEGRLPDNSPMVSLAQPRGTVLDALSAIAKQTGWSLVVTAPESATTRPLSIQVSKRPAGEVLDLVLDAGSLRASFADGVLRVRSDDPAKSADSWRERRRERRGRHGSERVVFGQSLTIGADETVDKAVAIGGSVTIAGHVRRDAVAIGGSITLLPGASVGGDSVAIGGAVSVAEGATLEGDNVSLGGAIPTTVGSMTRWVVGGPHMLSMFRFASRLTRAVLLLIIAVLIAAAFPGALTRIGAYLVNRPGLSALAGVALLLGFVPLCVLLAVTIIGLPLIPVAVMLLVALFLFGFTVSAAWLGERLPFPQANTPVKTVALGGVVLALVGLIPWIGTPTLFLATAFSAGATLLSRFGRTSAVAQQALMVMAAVVAAGTALVPGQALGAEPIELVTLRSGSYADFRQVFTREAPAGVSVPATLRFPDQARDRYPAVVVVHTISGFQEANEGWQAAELRRSGFATLTYDSFSARGLSRSAVIGSRAGPPLASGVADAFAALQFLAGHPRIAADRIGIVGFSFGGEVAHLTAFETLRAAMGVGPSRFAAHVATYPGGTYGARAEAGAYTGAPILMLLGEKDDNLPVAKAEGYLAYASAAGHPAPITTVVYPGAFHAWTAPTLGAPRFYPEYVASSRKCPVILFGRGAPTMLVDGRERPFDLDALAACQAAGSGYSMGYDAATRTKSAADTTAFLQRHLHP